MIETRTANGVHVNPTTSDSRAGSRRIHAHESDAFVSRVKEIIGDRKLTWFASECGVGESTLRNILSGAWPRTDILIVMANAGGVTVDWLATGRLPKTRAELKAGAAASEAAGGGLDAARLQLAIATVEEGLAATRRVMAPDKKAELVLAVYDLYQEPAVTRERVLKLVKSAA